MRGVRRWSARSTLCLLTLVSFEDLAAADTKACAQAARSGQLLRDSGKLVEARAAFVACAQASCPRVIQKDCAQWQADVDARTPTVVFTVRDQDGNRMTDVSVSIDGKELATKLDGRSQPIDPGLRKLSFKATDYSDADVEVTFNEGERARVVDVTMVTTKPRKEEKKEGDAEKVPLPSSTLPVLPLVFAGVALVGTGVFVGLTVSAANDVSDLEKTCKPNCTDAQVDPIRSKVTLSRVALGVGAAAAVASIVLFATSTGSSKIQVRGRAAPTWAGLELTGEL